MIFFVGAGSGAPDLITVRGQNLLKKADRIIYAGSLVNPQLLEVAKPGCVIQDSASMTLEQVVSSMLECELEGGLCVRLHTGDPSIYGAIREQMDCLEQAGVEYEIVPGVSSLCGAAAALRAEYTLPGVSQAVIISRMAGRTPVPQGQEVKNLAKHGATMVLFLSAGLLRQTQAELLEGGYAPDTPAAIVYKATWPDEQVFRCTVGTLAQTAEKNHISKTALITVGGFLGKSYERSKLYDPAFTTGYRKGTEI